MASDSDLQEKIIEALDQIQDPFSKKPVLDAHLIEAVEVSHGKVQIVIEYPEDRAAPDRHALEDAIADAVEKIEGVQDLDLVPRSKSGHGATVAVGPVSPSPAPGRTPMAKPQAPSGGLPAQRQIDGVDCVIAVASGKGGVGKSTVAANLALALHKLGFATGLLDIDIYGPSLPILFGIEGRPKVKDRRILPLKAYGLNVMSLGFLMEEDTPVIWRGPIVTGIIRQFLQDVDWRGTQYLIIDLPPGTGDAQLTLAQSAPLDGAIVVTTPSDLALIDAARGLQMFRTLNVDVLGIVENMSYYLWPGAPEMKTLLGEARSQGLDDKLVKKMEALLERNERAYIFGQGGGAREARRLGIDLLGEIPLDGQVRLGGDTGKPVVAVDESSPVTQAFMELAKAVAAKKPPKQAAEDAKKKGLFSFLRG
jgi:ATP-binding protein involved in chromosome partitioning